MTESTNTEPELRTYDADCREYIAFLYGSDNVHPQGATPPGTHAQVVAAAARWCHDAAEWDGRRKAVVMYHDDDLQVTVEGVITQGNPEMKVVRLEVVA